MPDDVHPPVPTRLAGVSRRAAAEQSGMALVLALGVMFVLATLVTSLTLYSVSNERSANRSRATVDVYALAASGVDAFASQLALVAPAGRDEPGAFAALTTADRTMTFGPGETVTWAGTLWDVRAGTIWDGTGPTAPYVPKLVWKVQSTATAPNPGGADPLSRTVRADVPLVPRRFQQLDATAWKYVYSKETGDPDGCDMELPNNPNVTSSFYVAGTLCLDNISAIVGPASAASDPPVDVVVRENVVLKKAGNTLGTPARPLSSLWVEGSLGCAYRAQPYHSPCTAADSAYPTSAKGSAPISPPQAAFEDWFVAASPGPLDPCTPELSSGAYGFLVDNGVPDLSQGVVDLDQLSSYDCRTPAGRLAWDAGARKLTVEGVVFVDGSIDLDSGAQIDYDGVATLYLSGWFRMHQTLLCARLAGSGCDNAAWDPAADMLLVAARASYTFGPACVSCSVLLEQEAEFQGALYGEYDMGFQNGAEVQGPMVSNREIIQNSFSFNYIPRLALVPFGTPGNSIRDWDVLPPTNYTG